MLATNFPECCSLKAIVDWDYDEPVSDEEMKDVLREATEHILGGNYALVALNDSQRTVHHRQLRKFGFKKLTQYMGNEEERIHIYGKNIRKWRFRF